MKLVCDTNVLISALVFPGGPPDQVFEQARAGLVEHATSPDILSELREVLTRKFRYDDGEADAFLDAVRTVSHLVVPTRKLRIVRRKDADNRILECAVEARADLLVTGDRRDLLPLRECEGVRIVDAATALRAPAEMD